MSDPVKVSRYRSIAGKRLIEVRVKSALQLFDARDPAPFRARDLDDDFIEYVVASAEEFPDGVTPKIVIYVEDPASGSVDRESILEAIHAYLDYQIDLKRIQLRKVFRTARLFCAIGVVCLFFCLLCSRAIDSWISAGSVSAILKEGLVIFGWVSLWKPFELMLFDWYPVYDRIRLFRRLVVSEVEVHFGAGAQQGPELPIGSAKA